ncbi:hypothetical protein, variant 2 [Exophiala oligosperma]|uniref:Protein kinase domain-containing protein n=1 Tax=Exophiala oligosperma TaxID=215243 RepID=A0A0D2DXC6_9EURO|nr:uncharacterized protein PV06_00423 [Exophiala oligosperma]XP_016267975.1 hypothetical protein, variant 1 [Exophiala oligosperma]XP_016267976.1 hypothetical protein, variant 2 [Exophiala oligosperma]KIW47758.1 hypothetical protein PV06_00423 [Exophiala oligosperma]KIW47759.1 hypothetical protein, variant 1 [Exophiala oligosperma]KIW47760.1 hypothetical protein, variant 2 [Exophiala oligosperma]
MLQYRHSRHKLTEELLRQVLSCVLRAIDYLHSECHLVHTDIKASNIMLGLDDDSVLQAFEANEMANPSPRNIYPDRTIYHSRLIDRPKAIGLPVLSDFGLARFEGGNADDDIQPEIYRAPEVLLDMDWNYPVDIWNVGAMIWISSTTNICSMLTIPPRTSFQINITPQKWQHTLARPLENF